MSKNLRMLTGIGIVLVVLAVLIAATAMAQGPAPQRPGNWMPGMMGRSGNWGYGMMGQGQCDQAGNGAWRFGMPGHGMGRHGTWGQDPVNCPAWNGDTPATGTPLSLEEAHDIAEQALATYGNSDLEIGEIMQFSQNFYVLVKETTTDKSAFELLIDPSSGAVQPEHGPNMMWNTKYGHMGMMGRWMPGQAQGEMTVTAEQALIYAQQWLDAQMPGSIAEDVDEFYGYYTLHTSKAGEITGMLSVNGYSGQVWYHSWHGDFIDMVGEHAE